MDTLHVTETTWRGLPAWRIAGRERTAVVTAIGGHLAAFTDLAATLNPLWVPTWPAADPATVRPGPACTWGDGPEASLLAGIAGSNLCIPIFGGPPAGSGLPVHGDAGVSHWTRADAPADAFIATLRTPQSGLAIERRLRLDGETLELATSVRHERSGAYDLDWCEHTTLGGAFLDGAEIDAGIDAAWTPDHDPLPGDIRRFAGRLQRIAPAQALALPASGDPPVGDVLAGRVTAGRWQARNQRLGWVLDARWDASEFPWLTLWTQHRERSGPPWNGRERTRGMELSTRPFPEPRSYAGADGCFQGRPVLCRIPAGTAVTKTLQLRWSRI